MVFVFVHVADWAFVGGLGFADTAEFDGDATVGGNGGTLTTGTPLSWASSVSIPVPMGTTPITAACRGTTFSTLGGFTEYSDVMQVNYQKTNAAPSVFAGLDFTAIVAQSMMLRGSALDDGLPNGANLSYTWSQIGGPSAVSFANATSQTSGVTFPVAGSYVLRLTVSDTALSAVDDVNITVLSGNPTNTAPVVNAGPDFNATVATAIALSGSASDDDLPSGSTLTYQWSVVSGPGQPASVAFVNAAAHNTSVTFANAGTYVLSLQASDGALSSSDPVSVQVAAAPALINSSGRVFIDFGEATTTTRRFYRIAVTP